MSYRIVTWIDDLSVSVRAFDQDHLTLIELLNEIMIAAQGGADAAFLLGLIRDLDESTRLHFTREEAYLRGIGFPDYERHRAEHARLLAQIDALLTKVETGDAVLSDETFDFLRHWLIDHIVDFDKPYAVFAAASVKESA